MKKIYIRFMAEVTELSVEKLFYIVDKAYRDKKTAEVHLLLSTLGGNVKQGIDVYNFLRGIPLKVTTYNFGTINSIGVVMFCAGEVRKSVPHSRFLFHPVTHHFPHRMDENQVTELKNSITVDQNNIARIVGDTLGKNREDVLRMMHKREVLNADEAEKINLVQSIVQELLPADAYLEVVKESDAFQDIIEPPENRAMRTITTKPYTTTTTTPYRTIAPRPYKTTTTPYRIITPKPYKTTTIPYKTITPKPYKTTTAPYKTITPRPYKTTTTPWQEVTTETLEVILAKTFHNNPSSVS